MFTSLVLYPSITHGSSSVHTLKSNVVAMSCLQYIFKRQSHWIVCFAQVKQITSMKSESRQTKNTTVFPRWEAKHLIGEVFLDSPSAEFHQRQILAHEARKIHMCHGWRGSLSTAKHENHWKSTFIEGSSLYREKTQENSASTILQLVINLVWYHCIEIILENTIFWAVYDLWTSQIAPPQVEIGCNFCFNALTAGTQLEPAVLRRISMLA